MKLKINRVLLLLVFVFIGPIYGKQENNVKGSILPQNLQEKSVRLDPLLRRALLRALTELEKEAQEKVRAEETRNVRSEPQNTNGNFIQDTGKEEIQNTADSNYPSPTPNNLFSSSHEIELTTNRKEENLEITTPVAVQDTFFHETSSTVEDNLKTSSEKLKESNAVLNSPDIATNLIVEEANDKEKDNSDMIKNLATTKDEKIEENDSNKEPKKSIVNDNEVDIFRAPLVAAFTLHQDSKGTPHSVVPLFRKEPQDSQRQLLNQQLALLKQQQQFLQNQLIPSVSITPLSQPNQLNPQPQASFFSPGTVASSFPASTTFPPLVSNSLLNQNFPTSVIPSQGFQGSTTVAPFRNNHQNFISTIPPQRNILSQTFPSTLLPPQDFNGVSVVQSHNFNFAPTPQPNFPTPNVTPSQAFQPISIPPVTLPLQNEPRFQSPIIVPSLQINPEQAFLQNQEQQRIRNQFFIDEQNRQRFIEQQNRQRDIEDQQRQRQIEEQNQQRQLEERNRQRKLEAERQKQLLEQNLRQQETLNQLRQQRQEQGVDFQRSLGFSFNQNLPPNFNLPTQVSSNAFNFHIQPSQSFVPSLNFQDLETRNRVNRQEGIGSTGNLGLVSNPSHQNFRNSLPQFQNNQNFPPFQKSQEYRTIPEEHYRTLELNQFQQNNGRNSQFSQQTNTFRQNNVQEVNKKLQNLLFQSGVAADAAGQEDLNIVSKVLALNHERSDTNINGPVLRNERKAEELFNKNLRVGEIKEAEVTTEFTETK